VEFFWLCGECARCLTLKSHFQRRRCCAMCPDSGEYKRGIPEAFSHLARDGVRSLRVWLGAHEVGWTRAAVSLAVPTRRMVRREIKRPTSK
jgi:hypothetical protein